MEFSVTKKHLEYLKQGLGKDNLNMAHVILDGKRASASNGVLGINIPFEIRLDTPISVNGTKFIAALLTCSDFPSIKVTDNSLVIKDGKFRALVPIVANAVDMFPPAQEPNGKTYTLSALDSAKLIDTIKTLNPFASKDTTRAVLTTVALVNGSFYATNGVVMGWKNPGFAEVILDETILFPRVLADIIAKLERVETINQADKIYVTTDDGVTIACAKMEGSFPTVDSVISWKDKGKGVTISDDVKAAVKRIAKLSDHPAINFEDTKIYNTDDSISISDIDISFPSCSLNAEYLTKIIDSVISMSLQETNPCYFECTENLHVIIMPMRK